MALLVRMVVVGAVLIMGCWLVAASAEQPVAQKGDPKPATGGPYELRVVLVGEAVQGVRFNVKSGESWLITATGWEKVPESGKVPSGNFDIHIVANQKDLVIFRLDRSSGATWQMKARKWEKVPEPEEK